MIYQIILGALMVVSTQAAAEPRRVQGPAAFIISGVRERQYADPNGIYVRTTVQAYHQLMSSKGQANVCPATRQVDTCYVQLKIFDNQPAWVILPARTGIRERRNVRNYFWEMYTTGEWQHVDRVERGLEGNAGSLFIPACTSSGVKKVGDLARGQRGLIPDHCYRLQREPLCGPDDLMTTIPRFRDGQGQVTVIDLDNYGEGLKQLQQELLVESRGIQCGRSEVLYQQANILLAQVTRKVFAQGQQDAAHARVEAPVPPVVPIANQAAASGQPGAAQELGDQKEDEPLTEAEKQAKRLRLQAQMAALQAQMDGL